MTPAGRRHALTAKLDDRQLQPRIKTPGHSSTQQYGFSGQGRAAGNQADAAAQLTLISGLIIRRWK
jgi:hypothetical protein